MGKPSRYDDSHRLEFLIDRPQLAVEFEETGFRRRVYDFKAEKPVSGWHDSAREALDDAIENQQSIGGGIRAP